MTSARVEELEKMAAPEAAEVSLLSQLLHALNQPLTGLQCSLELALSIPRSPQQYADCLGSGLELTGRMRNLVGAIRALVEIDGLALNPGTD